MSARFSSLSAIAMPAGGASVRVARGFAGLAKGLLAALAAVPAVWSSRRAVGLLVNADDAVLRDLGVTRQDVESALSGPLFRDPSIDLAARVSERRYAVRARHREEQRLIALTHAESVVRNDIAA